jgi:hypothetical protein
MRAADKAEADDLNLAKDLAMGAYAAFAGQPEADRSREEIDLVVAAIRARLQQVGLRKAG